MLGLCYPSNLLFEYLASTIGLNLTISSEPMGPLRRTLLKLLWGLVSHGDAPNQAEREISNEGRWRWFCVVMLSRQATVCAYLAVNDPVTRPIAATHTVDTEAHCNIWPPSPVADNGVLLSPWTNTAGRSCCMETQYPWHWWSPDHHVLSPHHH